VVDESPQLISVMANDIEKSFLYILKNLKIGFEIFRIWKRRAYTGFYELVQCQAILMVYLLNFLEIIQKFSLLDLLLGSGFFRWNLQDIENVEFHCH